MDKQWVVREKVSDNITEQLLFCRNVKIDNDYEKDLKDPFLLLNMDKAADRILKAIKNNEKVVIFGDYDADGVCSSAILWHFFKKIGFENFHVHIPDRNIDGYSITKEAITEFIEKKINLIITIDCGITNVDEVKMINQAGIEVIIIDHHLVPDILPQALAIVDPKQKEDTYSFKDFCGAGLAFKTVQALIAKGNFKILPGWEKWFLDLVCIATVADMMPLIDENRTLVYYGLSVFRKTKRAGLISLLRRMEINVENVTEDDISFMIGPRINLSSRMAHASISFELLTTESMGRADWITAKMETLNLERRNAIDVILKVAYEKFENVKEIPSIIILGSPEWNTGVLGLAAMRILEKYNRPVFLWGNGKLGKIRGNCRSDGSINLVEFMKSLPDIFENFGGHICAGGFSVKEESIDKIEEAVLTASEKITKQKTENDILYLDGEISIDDINNDFYFLIEKLSPFGVGNPKPVFLFKNLEIKEIKKFGNGSAHVRLNFKKNNGEFISAIKFFTDNHEKFNLEPGQKIDLAASLELSFYRNKPELRLKIVDVKLT